MDLRCRIVNLSAQDRSSGRVKSLTLFTFIKKKKNTEKRELINILAAGREQHKLTR